ncbi:MAG: hypothetical protein OEM82_16335 [Acidobacteriota bacterium]|nr:hypothetical protein [Acidobacteriota bacterium]MDH3529149.1 hypothetical protein [Acidobacteriota bacterium]
MAIEVKSEVFVERTPEEVAQVMFNPKLDKLWIRGLSEVYPMESGLYRKGAKIERIGTFLNKKYSAKLLVTKFEKNSFVQIYADEPFEMSIKYRLKASDGGTNVSITIASISEVDFNSPVSIISKSIKDSVDDDLKRFKLHLENNES